MSDENQTPSAPGSDTVRGTASTSVENDTQLPDTMAESDATDKQSDLDVPGGKGLLRERRAARRGEAGNSPSTLQA